MQVTMGKFYTKDDKRSRFVAKRPTVVRVNVLGYCSTVLHGEMHGKILFGEQLETTHPRYPIRRRLSCPDTRVVFSLSPRRVPSWPMASMERNS